MVRPTLERTISNDVTLFLEIQLHANDCSGVKLVSDHHFQVIGSFWQVAAIYSYIMQSLVQFRGTLVNDQRTFTIINLN